jgi:hypothetical protein
LTVTVVVTLQSLLFVYVIVVVPEDTPVTKPLLLTVATDTSLLNHASLLAGVPLPSKSVVDAIHTVVVPLIVGKAFTVTTTSSVFSHPLASVPVTVYVVVEVGTNDTPSLTPLFQL